MGANPASPMPPMQPWHRLSRIKGCASQLQMLRDSTDVLARDLWDRQPGQSTAQIMEQVDKASQRLSEHRQQIATIQAELWELLGVPKHSFALAVDLGDRTVVICDQGDRLVVRDLISAADHIGQMEVTKGSVLAELSLSHAEIANASADNEHY